MLIPSSVASGSRERTRAAMTARSTALSVLKAALAAGQGEQRLDELLLLVSGFQARPAGRAQRVEGQRGIGEGHLERGTGQGQWCAQFVGGVGDEPLWASKAASSRASSPSMCRRGP